MSEANVGLLNAEDFSITTLTDLVFAPDNKLIEIMFHFYFLFYLFNYLFIYFPS